MARGRGRGRGRGRTRNTILAFGSSVGTRVPADSGDPGQQENTPISNSGESSVEYGSTSKAADVAKKLQLTTPPSSVAAVIPHSSGGRGDFDEPKSNGTVPVNNTLQPEKGKTAESPWANLFKGNRASDNGMSLTYIPPDLIDGKPVVKLDAIEVGEEADKWRCALIAYFVGPVPGYNAMSRYIAQHWANVAAPDLYLHEEGYYVIKCHSIEDMHEVFYAGPYTVNNRPLILKPWTPEFDFSVEFPTEIPLWVKFPKLPMNCWGVNSLSQIASAIGSPIFADQCTTKQSRISFARMLIEVNVTIDLPEEITVMDPSGRVFLQEVVYDWRPDFCQTCQVVGHTCLPPQEPHRPLPRRNKEHAKVSFE
ncbi:hypothetical protein KY285_000580 [Solanum tuberosum]|nr:hypothetical protein KY285_000580 [Solanum tuberosum]